MTIEQFGNASYYVKKSVVKFQGIFLLKRVSSVGMSRLYQIDNFYIEVVFNPDGQNLPLISCYTVQQIDSYLQQIDISALTSVLD